MLSHVLIVFSKPIIVGINSTFVPPQKHFKPCTKEKHFFFDSRKIFTCGWKWIRSFFLFSCLLVKEVRRWIFFFNGLLQLAPFGELSRVERKKTKFHNNGTEEMEWKSFLTFQGGVKKVKERFKWSCSLQTHFGWSDYKTPQRGGLVNNETRRICEYQYCHQATKNDHTFRSFWWRPNEGEKMLYYYTFWNVGNTVESFMLAWSKVNHDHATLK